MARASSAAASSATGLSGSIWASERSHTYTRASSSRATTDPRSRSVPPQSLLDLPPLPTQAPSLIASASAPSAAATASSLAPARALHRLEQTCLRLRWKSIDLDSSWQRVDPEVALSQGFDPDVAERNFKLDFYEFYTWIEQAIVLLQRIFGIEIMAGGAGGSGTRGRSTHAYHHNVLTALGDADNALHGVLGTGEVYQALWKAKELRNRWKDEAGEVTAETPPIRMYHLQWIVGRILAGLGEAYDMAAEVVRRQAPQPAGQMDIASSMVGGQRQEELEGWDWMVEEPMDWEA
ncbi:hypothetical protein GMORB2_1733 [Geosmithia morbida]|uniref:Uncharacterized protein n=1 Tax=Geosmithia morbida TaxID=1094350 RepID=A0A9P5CZR6_9HYPO|nr:uncharacterized protein GMORB2_1733 [Geosmithia morbida]KAF4121893.1 hypothetical protein GMORB2_1733 [Geosmithia morbida]